MMNIRIMKLSSIARVSITVFKYSIKIPRIGIFSFMIINKTTLSKLMEVLKTMPSTANMHKKTQNFEKQSNHSLLTKISGVISLCSLHTPVLNQTKNKKKPITPTNRKFIDLTLKRQGNRLSHQSSASSLAIKQSPNKICMSRSNIFQTQKSILSSVSLNSVQFTTTSSTSEHKKVLTITCHKYDGVKGNKMKTESISKCNSIKMFRKFI